ncbi:MAG: heme exporter protein CcmD [Hyphomicrobiaceae bacterium]
MLDLGKHAVFIWASYGIVTLVLVLMIAWLIADGLRYTARLKEFDERGIGRRRNRPSEE